MSDGNALASIGELSRPVTVLIEKISDAVGGIFLPHQIKRVAAAEAEVALIEARSKIEITELQRRAVQRFLSEEERRQENIESIVQKALPSVSQDAKTDDVDNDWLVNFFDKGRLISDDDMQTLWSKVLAGEANSPGSCSKRTVAILAAMDKKEAELFQSFCTFIWDIGGLTPLVYDVQDPIYNAAGIHFNTLQHLEVMGLIKFDNLVGFLKIYEGVERGTVEYYQEPFTLQLPGGKSHLDIGKALLTSSGKELAVICGSSPSEAFRDYVLARWTSQNLYVPVISAD